MGITQQCRKLLECDNCLTHVMKELIRQDTLLDLIPLDSEDLVKHMKVRGNLGCTDCDSRVQGEGSRVERITALDSGEQTPMSAGLCLEESLEILCWREDRTRRSGSLLGTTSISRLIPLRSLGKCGPAAEWDRCSGKKGGG